MVMHINYAMTEINSISCLLPQNTHYLITELIIYNEFLPQTTFWQNTLDEKNALSPTLPNLQVSHQIHPAHLHLHLHLQERQPSPTNKNPIHNGKCLIAQLLQ
jgi:hypothetical protein